MRISSIQAGANLSVLDAAGRSAISRALLRQPPPSLIDALIKANVPVKATDVMIPVEHFYSYMNQQDMVKTISLLFRAPGVDPSAVEFPSNTSSAFIDSFFKQNMLLAEHMLAKGARIAAAEVHNLASQSLRDLHNSNYVRLPIKYILFLILFCNIFYPPISTI
jgi:hypothetical protein